MEKEQVRDELENEEISYKKLDFPVENYGIQIKSEEKIMNVFRKTENISTYCFSRKNDELNLDKCIKCDNADCNSCIHDLAKICKRCVLEEGNNDR